jgi:hypothetical protein
MKPFNLEEAKAGKPVCTRDGDKVRIICFDCKSESYPIVALRLIGDIELISTYTKDGKYQYNPNNPDDMDLMMADVIHEGYINIYKKDEGVVPGKIIYETEEKAKKYNCTMKYLDTIKIQWKE